jgi:hypothetical protein
VYATSEENHGKEFRVKVGVDEKLEMVIKHDGVRLMITLTSGRKLVWHDARIGVDGKKPIVQYYLPKVKKALEYAVKNTDIKSIGLDESDKYWTCIRTDYNFMGMDKEQRLEFARLKGWTYPQKIV